MNKAATQPHHAHHEAWGANHTPDQAAHHLQHHGVRPTAVRILVWNYASRRRQTFTLADAADAMPDMDRSSLFRALRLFVEHKLLHEVDDGSGQCKYCLCRCQEGQPHNPDAMHRGHVHFSCTHCGRTYCIQDQPIPLITLPDGFQPEEAEFVVKGTCKVCAAK